MPVKYLSKKFSDYQAHPKIFLLPEIFPNYGSRKLSRMKSFARIFNEYLGA